ncbi:MAG: PTS sugar transporter subunit IIB [Termitinemataceae bacterium]|nr:MAG: PTS sugar transporter subunit IIB [Termitinemataceae bacterium]
MTNIVLVCAAGMSTSMLVQKMQDSAKKNNKDVSIKAVAESDFANHADGVNVLLLGPQVRFKFDEMKAAWEPKGIKVSVINQVDYGRMNGEKVLNDALAM